MMHPGGNAPSLKLALKRTLVETLSRPDGLVPKRQLSL